MILSTGIRTLLASDPGAYGRPMFYAFPRNRGSGAIEEIGFWAGADHEEIVVGGVTRLYYAADGNMIFPRGIVYSSGTTIQMTEMLMGPLTIPAQQLLRAYEPKQARCEIHIRFYGSDGIPVGIARAFKGRIDQTPMSTSGGWGRVESVARLNLAPASREGTKIMPETRSDETYRRNNGDRIGRYMAVGGVVKTPWGTKEVK